MFTFIGFILLILFVAALLRGVVKLGLLALSVLFFAGIFVLKIAFGIVFFALGLPIIAVLFTGALIWFITSLTRHRNTHAAVTSQRPRRSEPRDVTNSSWTDW